MQCDRTVCFDHGRLERLPVSSRSPSKDEMHYQGRRLRPSRQHCQSRWRHGCHRNRMAISTQGTISNVDLSLHDRTSVNRGRKLLRSSNARHAAHDALIKSAYDVSHVTKMFATSSDKHLAKSVIYSPSLLVGDACIACRKTGKEKRWGRA
jgi:hypothetical protein